MRARWWFRVRREKEEEGFGGAGSSANADVAEAASTSTSTSSSLFAFFSRLRPPPPRVLLSEASGAMGDLGTFLPLTLGLVAAVGLDFGTTLIFTGIYNVVSGFVFGVPMPVQPMKTIAAIAVASVSSSNPITLQEVMAGGMFVSAVVLFLGITKLVDLVNRIVPRSVVAGLQLGVGLKLASSGVRSVFLMPAGSSSKSKQKEWKAAGGAEGWALGAAALVFLFVSTVSARGRGREGKYSSSFSSPSLLPLPRRLREALLERKNEKRRRQRGGGGEGDSSSSSSSNGSGASAEPPLPLASPPPPPPPPPAVAAAAPPEGEEENIESSPSWQVPSALLVTILGVALAFASAPAAALSALRLGPSKIVAAIPSLQDWLNGITRAGGLAQLPLTTLNSVIAVSHLADSLFGGRGGGAGTAACGTAAAAGGVGCVVAAPSSSLLHQRGVKKDKARWKPSRVAVAVGLYNLLGGWFGAVPACMGSGGLAAQHKFGARGGTAPVLLGIFKISLALAFGSSLSSILKFFPSGLLGAMLTLAGAELAAAARAGNGDCGGGGGGERERKKLSALVPALFRVCRPDRRGHSGIG